MLVVGVVVVVSVVVVVGLVVVVAVVVVVGLYVIRLVRGMLVFRWSAFVLNGRSMNTRQSCSLLRMHRHHG